MESDANRNQGNGNSSEGNHRQNPNENSHNYFKTVSETNIIVKIFFNSQPIIYCKLTKF
jgi:hypothetical protein